jgi:hypothetical protein
MNAAWLGLALTVAGAAWWFGLYLLARDPGKPLLRLTGLGLLAYALALALDLLLAAPAVPAAPTLTTLAALLVLGPALAWSGALLYLLPENWPWRDRLARLWRRSLLPTTALAAAALLVAGGLGVAQAAGVGYAALALLLLTALLGCAALVVRRRATLRPTATTGLVLAATLFFALGLGALALPLGWLPRPLLLLGIGLDLALLGAAIAHFDAFDEGERLTYDLLRSGTAALGLALLFGGPVALTIVAAGGPTVPLLALLLAIVALAVALAVLAHPAQAALDRIIFARLPGVRQARADARAVAAATLRLDPALDLARLDEAEFARLTRRALSHYGDLSRLAASPLTHLPTIDARLARRGLSGSTLERAAELKLLLAESVARLKPPGPEPFGSSDEWRYYNALYFPYILGLKPFSQRTPRDELDPVAREALDWFASAVPERTLHNWQTAAARLVSHDLREHLLAGVG